MKSRTLLLLALAFVVFKSAPASAQLGALFGEMFDSAVYEVSGTADSDFDAALETAERQAREGKVWYPENVYMSEENRAQIEEYSRERVEYWKSRSGRGHSH